MKNVKYLWVLVNFVILNIVNVNAQEYSVLQVGDTIPSRLYNEVAGLGHAGELFSKTKNKLIILDFWGTYCSTCIKSFPKMKALQDEFGDKIQIFLVNGTEDSVRISKRMNIPAYKNYKVDLPIIANAKALMGHFPHRSVPYHVWIDNKGVVRGIGSPLNTNGEKIRLMLDDKDVFFLNSGNNSKAVNERNSLFEIESKIHDSSSTNSFLFTNFNNEYSAGSSRSYTNIVDSIGKLVRDTYFNLEVIELYKEVFYNDITSMKNKMTYSGVPNSNSESWKKKFILNLNDSTKVSSTYLSSRERTDQDYIKSRYCYEQILPQDIKEVERQAFMLENLNKYFGAKLGVKGSLVQRNVLCYVLSSKNKNSIPNRNMGFTPLNLELSKEIVDFFSRNPNQYLDFMIDESGFETFNEIKSSRISELASIKDLELFLSELGITLNEEFRTLNFVLIEDIE